MKRTLVMTAALTAAAAVFLAGLYFYLCDQRNHLKIAEVFTSGNPNATESIQIEAGTEYRDFRWDTAYSPKNPEKAVVSFSRKIPKDPSIGTDMENNLSVLSHISADSQREKPYGISQKTAEKMCSDAALQITGRSGWAYLPLRKYIQQLSLDVSFSVKDHYVHIENEDGSDFSKSLQMPVPDTAYIPVYLEKNAQGKIQRYQISGDFEAFCCSAISETDIFFAFTELSVVKKNGVSAEVPIPENAVTPGIYHLPLRHQKGAPKEALAADFNRMRRICDLPSGTKLLYLAETQDKSSLLLFTKESGKIHLSAYDKNTGRQMQKTIIDASENNFDIAEIMQKKNHLLICFYDGTLCLLQKQHGTYQKVFHTPANGTASERICNISACDFDYDGHRLAAAFTSSSCETALFVFDENGAELYTGISRLSVVPQKNPDMQEWFSDDRERPLPATDRPLRVTLLEAKK